MINKNINQVFFFQPVLKRTIWGGEDICQFKHISSAAREIGECWEVSGVRGSETHVVGGMDDGMTLAELTEKYGASFLGLRNYERYGNEFPLLIKYISAASDLSVQVHPDNRMAHTLGHPFGKTEMWYIIRADKEAQLVSGFSQHITPEEYEERVANGTLRDVLAYSKTHADEVYFIPAGRIHAIGAGNFLLEIQQSSDDTFRVYDYNRTDDLGQKRELHIEKAKEALDFNDINPLPIQAETTENETTPVLTCEEFTTSVLSASQSTRIDMSGYDSFSVLSVVEGKATCRTDYGVDFTLEAGVTVVLPAITDYIDVNPEGKVKMIEVHIS